jgi:hypothetical protein
MWGKAFSKHLGGKPGLLIRSLVLLLLCALTAAGCTQLYDPESAQEFNTQIVGNISINQDIGQTFISHRARLSGIILWVDSGETPGELTLDLFHDPSHTEAVFSSTVKVETGAIHISIPPQSGPANQVYYVQLSTTGDSIAIFGRDEDIYPHGSAYRDGSPIEQDLAFRATYDYDIRAVFSDLASLLKGWHKLLLALGMLVLPGWLMLGINNHHETMDLGEKIALSIGLSMAALPVLMLWTTTIGLTWDPTLVKLSGLAVLAGCALRLFKIYQERSTRPRASRGDVKISAASILVLVFMAALFLRLAFIRDLSAPAWVDSVHHSIIAKAILNFGGYPPDYLPHIPTRFNQYHPGYHSLLAAFCWLSGMKIPDGMLFLGQILNALMVFPVYLMGSTLLKDKKAAVIAAMITGLISLMPAYYTSWGRYTQLAGLLVLPAGIRWFADAPHKPIPKSIILIGGVILAGLFLIHYRVLIFWGCLILAWFVGEIYRRDGHTWQRISRQAVSVLTFSLSGALVSLPWVIPTVTQFAMPLSVRRGNIPPLNAIHWQYLTPVFGIPVMILAGVGLVLGILSRRRFSIKLLVWAILLFGIANARYFHLPFPGNFVNQTSVEIMMFMPISLLAGYTASQGKALSAHLLPNQWKKLHTAILAAVGISAAVLGSKEILGSLNPETVLFRAADKAAISWIATHIPADETIVINPTGWGYGLYRGSDGGYWISPLAGQATIPSNAFYGASPDLRDHTNQFVESLLPIGERADLIFDLLQNYGYRYIYVGARGGILSPHALAEDPSFKTLYHHENTWVFEALKTE